MQPNRPFSPRILGASAFSACYFGLMAAEGERLWFVRGGAEAERFLDEGIVAIGWMQIPPVRDLDDAEVERRFEEAFPSHKPAARRMWAGQVKRLSGSWRWATRS